MPAWDSRAHQFADEVIEQAATQLAVFVRPAKLADAEHLIHLNQAFRYEMAQWEAGVSDSEGEDQGYPVLDYDDVEFILTQEEPENLIVLGRRLENEERIIGYSYSYSEPWESAVGLPAKRTRIGKYATPRKQPPGSKRRHEDEEAEKSAESLYLAELFIVEQERGLGLGELLLTGTLHARNCAVSSSHLFVSSQNVSAVKCYMKFGYDRGTRPSGDAAHDLVMEMRNCQENVMRSVERLSQQLLMGTIGARRRRKPTVLPKKDKERTTGDSPTYRLDSRSASATSTASTEAVSRSCSRSSIRTSPPPHAVKPRASKATTCSEEPEENLLTRRSSRHASEQDSFDLGTTPIVGRQRKPMRPIASKSKASSKRSAKADAVNNCETKLVTRKMKRPKFLLTGMRTSAVAHAKAVISRLSGEVIDTDFYDPSATHIIAPRALRTEKFLCALAAGKYLLKAAYIQDCEVAGRMLPEEAYEWEICSHKTSTRHLFNDKAVSSRLRSSGTVVSSFVGKRTCNGSPSSPSKTKGSFSCTGNPAASTSGCFAGIVATLLISQEKKDCFRRVLEAGSANLRSKSFGQAVDPSAVTHAFVSRDLIDAQSEGWTEGERRTALKQLEALQDFGVPCFFDNLIVDFLTVQDPDVDDYMVPPVGAKSSRCEKRKAGRPQGIEQYCKKARTGM